MWSPYDCHGTNIINEANQIWHATLEKESKIESNQLFQMIKH